MLRILFTISYFSIGVFSKYWEPDCIGDEFDGVCVQPQECFSTNPYINGLKYPLPCTTTYGYPGVCCTDCELVTNANDAILDKSQETGVLWKTGEKAWDKCLEYVQKYKYKSCNLVFASMMRQATDDQCHSYKESHLAGYAVGGSDVTRGEYPHMALLGYEGTTSPSEWLCSGSLISDRFILTAAHCIYSRDLGPVTDAAFGVLKRSDPPEYWQKYKIKRVIAHPDYKAPSKYHDIALLETEIPVRFINETVLPACLPAHEKFIKYNSKFGITATGWGDLGYLKKLADTMQKVSLTKFNDEECEDMYPTHRLLKSGLDLSAQMCYGDKTTIKDTCKGDSGGALQMDTSHPSCMHTIIGVTSYGQECGFLGVGGVYTKVARYLPWIESVVWP